MINILSFISVFIIIPLIIFKDQLSQNMDNDKDIPVHD